MAATILSVLEPKSGFEIAFNMFDVDGNQKVDINEFKVVSYRLHVIYDSLPV